MGAENIKVVADAGYCNAKEVKVCEEAGIEAYTPRIPTSNCRKQGLCGKEQFRFDLKKNCYYCPAGKTLSYRFTCTEKKRDKDRLTLYYEGTDCKQCAQKHLCTYGTANRRLQRCPEEDAIDRMNERIKAHPEIMEKRKQIAEHPLGTIKFRNDQGHFLMRGLEKVRAEFSLSTLAYNMKRAINVLGVEKLVQAMA